MPPPKIKPTPYPYINAAVQVLLTNVKAVLGDYFLGLYLHGSLALGDFDPGHSDIDFLVVTKKALPKKMVGQLEAMHAHIIQSGPEWVDKLEGSYLSKKAIRRYNPEETPHPHVWEQKFRVARDQRDWIIHRHILREYGVIVAGPPIKSMIDPVSPDELQEAIVTTFREAWVPKLNEREWLIPTYYQAYVTLTCCRALYTIKFGIIASKPASARWALKVLGKKWTDLIEAAIAWRYGDPHGDIEKTLQFMRYTMDQIGVLRPQ